MNYEIVSNLSPAIVRNMEGDNLSVSGTTTLLEITEKADNILTLNYLPENLIKSGIDWFVQSLTSVDYNGIDPGYFGDYLVQDKITNFDFVNKKITLIDATDFDVGGKICIYSPWANYEFIGDQTGSGIIIKGGSGWRSKYVSSGPVWYDEVNSRYVLLVNGRSNADNGTIGFAYSNDLESWTMGNGDAPIIDNSDHTNFATHVIAEGNVVELNGGRVAFTVTGFDVSNYSYCHIIEMDRDCTNISISGAVISGNKYYASGLTKYNNKYVICALNANLSIELWTAEMWDSDSLITGYSKVCDILTTQYDDNDSIWLEGHSDGFCPFVENGKLYCWISGVQRYIISAIRGNRTMGLIVYDDAGNSWLPANDFAPEIIFPMYFYNIPSEDYGWAAGHVGGYISFIKRNSECYLFCSFTRDAGGYHIAALKIGQKSKMNILVHNNQLAMFNNLILSIEI